MLDYSEVIAEKELIQLCVKGMQDECKLYIENHIVLTFSNLMKKVENTKVTISKLRKEKQVKRDVSGSWDKRFLTKKPNMLVVVEQPH